MTRAQRREEQEVAVLEAARAQLAVRAVVRQVRALVTQAAAILFLLLLLGCRLIAADVTDLTAEAATDERRADRWWLAQVRRTGVQSCGRADVTAFTCNNM